MKDRHPYLLPIGPPLCQNEAGPYFPTANPNSFTPGVTPIVLRLSNGALWQKRIHVAKYRGRSFTTVTRGSWGAKLSRSMAIG